MCFGSADPTTSTNNVTPFMFKSESWNAVENSGDIFKRAFSDFEFHHQWLMSEQKLIRATYSPKDIKINPMYISSIVLVALFTLSPMISMGYDYYTKGETELKLPFLVKYFFDPFTKNRWAFMYFHQVSSTYIAAFNFFGPETLLYSFCIYIKIHFQLLCNPFEDLVSLSNEETKQKMIQLVKRHQELIHLVNQVEMVYSPSILFNIVTSTFLICLSGFNVMILEGRVDVTTFLLFLSVNLSQISLLCVFGDMLMSSSLKLNEAIYNCRWYETDGRIKKDILFCIIMTQRPCKLTAGKFVDINLKALTTILSRTWSLFAFLRTTIK